MTGTRHSGFMVNQQRSTFAHHQPQIACRLPDSSAPQANKITQESSWSADPSLCGASGHPHSEPTGEGLDGSMKAHHCDRKLQPHEIAVQVVPRSQKLSGRLCFTSELLRESTRKREGNLLAVQKLGLCFHCGGQTGN